MLGEAVLPGCTGLVRVMRLMLRLLISWSTLLLLLYSIFEGGLNPSRMFSRASGSTDFLQVGG